MNLITTIQAKCRDCYKCLRACPVKAINFQTENNQEVHAQVIQEQCIADGRCVQVCPQNAKRVDNKLDEIKALLSGGCQVAASVAPSFVSGLPLANPDLLVPALKKMGFSLVQETAVGAELVAHEHNLLKNKSLISSACPVVINLVEQYYPQLLPHLSPIVSPLIAHGRLLKIQDPKLKVVFVGPCIAKKAEIASAEVCDAVDYSLDFTELWQWFTEEKIDFSQLVPTPFDGYQPNLARLFPVEGGMLRSTNLSTDTFQTGSITLTGLENCIEFLKNLSVNGMPNKPGLLELLACNGGCVGGPRVATDKDVYRRREEVIDYYNSRSHTADCSLPELEPKLMYRNYVNRAQKKILPNEQQIKDILAKTGKENLEDELNCGSCGYGSCREKAIAVYHGHAEVQMCIPYMRQRAEFLSNRILTTIPNGVIIVTDDLKIVEVNKFAEKMFKCLAPLVIGQELSRLFNPKYFQQVINTGLPMTIQNTHPAHGLVTREMIFPLEREHMVVGIFVDITQERQNQIQLKQMKTETIERAGQVIEKQMKVAQEIAGLLGETTAETKILLSKLIKLMSEEENSNQKR